MDEIQVISRSSATTSEALECINALRERYGPVLPPSTLEALNTLADRVLVDEAQE